MDDGVGDEPAARARADDLPGKYGVLAVGMRGRLLRAGAVPVREAAAGLEGGAPDAQVRRWVQRRLLPEGDRPVPVRSLLRLRVGQHRPGDQVGVLQAGVERRQPARIGEAVGVGERDQLCARGGDAGVAGAARDRRRGRRGAPPARRRRRPASPVSSLEALSTTTTSCGGAPVCATIACTARSIVVLASRADTTTLITGSLTAVLGRASTGVRDPRQPSDDPLPALDAAQ